MAESMYQTKKQENQTGGVSQRKSGVALQDNRTARQPITQLKPNKTGLPDNLKSGMENLSGHSLDHVRVHYNSPKPAQLNAHAYAQGSNIHLASGQEKHLPHELGHVVQQAQGRVRPTMQMKGGVAVNDNPGLESEATLMGERAISVSVVQAKSNESDPIVLCKGSDMRLSNQGNPTQLNKRKKNKNRHKKKVKEQRKQDAIDRLDRGNPDIYDHLDPLVADGLRSMELQQPRNSAARKNSLKREMLAKKPTTKEDRLPRVIEAGAGEGRFSSAFRKKFGSKYLATDIAPGKGPNGFLRVARKSGIRTHYGVDANRIGKKIGFNRLKGKMDHVVGANPFGQKGTSGASYGLMAQNVGGKGKQSYLPDDRFLKSAKPLLKPGGSVELYGRSNVMREAKLAKHPIPPKKKKETEEELETRKKLLKVTEQAREKVKEKYPGENANPYLAIEPGQLSVLAKSTGYRVNVKRAKQPPNVVKGGNPDTVGGDKERAKTGLKPFNTRFTFTPEESDYVSDDENPRVNYDSGDESDWEE